MVFLGHGVFEEKVGLEETQFGLQQFIDADWIAFGLLFAAAFYHHGVDDGVDFFDIGDNRIEVFESGHFQFEHFGCAEDHAQRRFDIVRDAGGEQADREKALFRQNLIDVYYGVTISDPDEIVKTYLAGDLESGVNLCDH